MKRARAKRERAKQAPPRRPRRRTSAKAPRQTATPPQPGTAPPAQGAASGPEGPTLRSQTQVEIRLGRGERPLNAAEQAARLASAQMERRIGRLLSRRVKLKFRRR